MELTSGEEAPKFEPIEFRSSQPPVKVAGVRTSGAAICPRGPSFEKATMPGS